MRTSVFATVLVLVALGVAASQQQPTLRITAPPDQAQVAERPFVEGDVSDGRAKVWVIVHPMDGQQYWVQPKVSDRGSGKWKVQIHVGDPGRHVGVHFEVRAVANPVKPLKVGEILDDWPQAEVTSALIEVIRR